MSICKRYSREQLFKKIYLDYESKIKYFVFWIFEFLKDVRSKIGVSIAGKIGSLAVIFSMNSSSCPVFQNS